MEVQRHIIQQQIQGFTQEEGSPLGLVKMKKNTYLLMMKAFKQTMSLPRLARVQRMMMRKGMILTHKSGVIEPGVPCGVCGNWD